MPCNDPRRIFYTGGVNPETGKRNTLFTSRHIDFIYRRDSRDKWNIGKNTSPESAAYTKSLGYQVVTEHDDIPCGQCLACRMTYARNWSARIMNEVSLYPSGTCWFVTCTYDDEHLPPAKPVIKIDEETGEINTKISKFNSLCLKDHQDFMKRLRKEVSKYSDTKVRFFASGEYGDVSFRPHFHYILFGVPIPDLNFYKLSKAGDKLYNSEWLQKIWNNADGERPNKGYVVIGSVTPDSASYIARYAIKKRKHLDDSFYEDLGLKPEFLVMSRKPGIGKEWFEKNYKSMYETDEVIMPGRDKAISVKPPKYYDTLMERIDPELINNIKQRRKYIAEKTDEFISDYLPFYDKEVQLETKERNLTKSMFNLERRTL